MAHVLEWFGFASAHVPQLTSHYFAQEQDIQYANAGIELSVAFGAGGGPAAGSVCRDCRRGGIAKAGGRGESGASAR